MTSTDLAARARLDLSRIEVHYQPIVDLASHRVIGLEALARWRTDDGSLAGPDTFIPAAESDGSIVALGRHVLETAANDVAHLDRAGLNLHVNVSPCQLPDGLFPIHVHNALADSGLSPRQLVLELTEGRSIVDVRTAAVTLSRLHEVGIRTALDDFGVGQSSPSRLRRLPVSMIKIDRAYVQTDVSSLRRRTEAMVSRALRSGVDVVAEGIEEPAQADWLQRLGCRHGQGFLYARPMPLEDVRHQLADRRPALTAGF